MYVIVGEDLSADSWNRFKRIIAKRLRCGIGLGPHLYWHRPDISLSTTSFNTRITHVVSTVVALSRRARDRYLRREETRFDPS